MITLTISSSIGDPITVTDDGSGVYETETWDPGPIPIVNDLSEGRVLDGADVSNSKSGVGSVALRVRCAGTDLDDAWAKATDLQKVVEADDGTGWQGDPWVTVTETFGTIEVTHDCFRAAADIIRDPILMEESIFVVAVTLQCYFRYWSTTP